MVSVEHPRVQTLTSGCGAAASYNSSGRIHMKTFSPFSNRQFTSLWKRPLCFWRRRRAAFLRSIRDCKYFSGRLFFTRQNKKKRFLRAVLRRNFRNFGWLLSIFLLVTNVDVCSSYCSQNDKRIFCSGFLVALSCFPDFSNNLSELRSVSSHTMMQPFQFTSLFHTVSCQSVDLYLGAVLVPGKCFSRLHGTQI